LVAVLREALTRDGFERQKAKGEKARKGEVAQEVKAFIQNVHHFRDAGLRDDLPPADHVVIFDEAQRAWNLRKTAKFMQQRKKRPGFSQSEPEFLLSYLDRHKDWAVVVCLVGGGQEINEGEAGISAWLEAVRTQFPSWGVYISPELTDSEYAAGHALEALAGRAHVIKDTNLHLGVSVRSFRAENLSRFVKAVLDCDRVSAKDLLASMGDRYPMAITRDLNRAKQWIRRQARGTERYGLVASSGAQRLKPHAIDVRIDVDPVQWFLNDADDTRSSFYLEDAATEFQVQGLELDWTCVTWDADLRFDNECWKYHSFRGSRWTNVHALDLQRYLVNAYRVLLTRARQGMVICVPNGDTADPTRAPAYYDSTFDYLEGVGIPVL
ncbi:MAG: DNA/RNA helicase domain-containing protein, partial [Gemmatimonadales bacterium]